MYLKALVFLFLSLILSSCLASPSNTSFTGPTGKTYYTAKCNVDPSKCFSQATQQCSGSYQVVNSESHAGGTLADIFPGPVTWYGMTYICGPSDGKYPSFPFQGQVYVPPSFSSGSSSSTQQQLDQLKGSLATDCINKGGVPTASGGCL